MFNHALMGSLMRRAVPVDPGDYWVQVADFGGGVRRSIAHTVTDAGVGYAGTGRPNSSTRAKDLWSYDNVLNTWEQKADFPGTARTYATMFSIGEDVYLGGGHDSANKADYYKYTPANNSWVSIADFAGAARYGKVGFTLNNKGYVGAGYRFAPSVQHFSDFWCYDPDINTWSQVASYIDSVMLPFVTIHDGKAYVGGGDESTGFAVYDADANTWTPKANLLFSIHAGVAFSAGGFIYAGLGRSAVNGTYHDIFVRYNIPEDTWEAQETVLPILRAEAMYLPLLTGVIIGAGREDGVYSTASVHKYVPPA